VRMCGMSRTWGVLRGESKDGGRRSESRSRKFLARNYVWPKV